MTNKKNKNIKESYEDCWMYILLLTTLVILLESLKSYTFMILNIKLTYSLLLLPLVYFLVNCILKKYEYKKAVAAIAISGVLFVSFMAIISFAIGKHLPLSSLSGEFCGYVISQFVNLTLYIFILNNTKTPWVLVFLTYLFSLVVFYMFYTLINLNVMILDNFWTGYLFTIAIQFVICLPLSIIDINVKRKKGK